MNFTSFMVLNFSLDLKVNFEIMHLKPCDPLFIHALCMKFRIIVKFYTLKIRNCENSMQWFYENSCTISTMS